MFPGRKAIHFRNPSFESVNPFREFKGEVKKMLTANQRHPYIMLANNKSVYVYYTNADVFGIANRKEVLYINRLLISPSLVHHVYSGIDDIAEIIEEKVISPKRDKDIKAEEDYFFKILREGKWTGVPRYQIPLIDKTIADIIIK